MGLRFGGGSNTPPPEPEPKVTFYTEANYGGTFKSVGHGAYEANTAVATRLWDFRLRSVKVPPGFTVTLYDDPKFKGSPRVFTSDCADFGKDYDDRACSYTVAEPKQSSEPSKIVPKGRFGG